MEFAIEVVPGVFRWAFWAGRNIRCTSGPSQAMLREMYSPFYMLFCLRRAGVSQLNSLDVNVYLLLLDALFQLRVTLFAMTRDDSGVQSLSVQVTTGPVESAGDAN